jgi:murein L,D-transpeptidase YafK
MKQLFQISFFLLFLLFFSRSISAEEKVWLLIDTNNLTLEIKKGNKTIVMMKNIAIGRNGAGFKKKIGDGTTPIGTYRIGWINTGSPFYKFYGFDYPSVENANEALLSGLISKSKHSAIIKAHKNTKTPPQNTAIGGRIGIHGLGAGDEAVHKVMNWTHGCIALTNEQIDLLDKWVIKGTQVKIK